MSYDLTSLQFALLLCGLPLAAFGLPWLIHWWHVRKQATRQRVH